MKNLKFGAFFLGLIAAVGSAVAILGAQSTVQIHPGGRSDLMVLDGRGSQLGVMVSDVDAKSTSGVRIDEINENSPAEKAGLRQGDIVVEFDGERVRSARQLTRLIQETPEGRSVSIGVMRDGKRQTVNATPEIRSFSWNMDIDGDRIRREAGRALRERREFGVEPPLFRFEPGDRNREFLYELLPQLRSRGRLGVNVQDLSSDLAEYFGVKNGGALVSSVTQGSAAEKAGIKAGDVIVSVNSTPVNDGDDLIRELTDVTSGEITLGVVRDKKSITLKATIEARNTRPRAGSRPGLIL